MSAFPLLNVNHSADAAIEPYRIVKAGSADGYVAQAAAPTDALVGISGLVGADAAGARLDVEHAGIVLCQYGAAVTRGDFLTSDADGKAVPALAGERVIAIALESGVLDEQGRVLITGGSKDGTAGAYVPVLTGVTNVDAVTLRSARYIRVGDIVHVTLDVSVDPTAAAATQVRATLPVASAIADDFDVSGVATKDGGGAAGSIKGDAANDEALLDFTAAAGAAETWRAVFSYIVQ